MHKPKVNQILRGEVAIPRRVKTLGILAKFLLRNRTSQVIKIGDFSA